MALGKRFEELSIDPEKQAALQREIEKNRTAKRAGFMDKVNPLGGREGLGTKTETSRPKLEIIEEGRRTRQERPLVGDTSLRILKIAEQRTEAHRVGTEERMARMAKRARGEKIKGFIANTILEYQRRSAVDRMLANQRGGALKEIGKAAFGAVLMEWLRKGANGEARFQKMREGLLKGNERVMTARERRLRDLGKMDGGKHREIAEAIRQRDAWDRRANKLLKEYNAARRLNSRSGRRMAA